MMEQARISSSQGTQPAQGVRPRQAGDGAQTGSPQGGFLALLTAMSEASGADGGLPGALGNGLDDLASQAADDPGALADVSALAAWQGLVAAGQQGGLQNAAGGGAVGNGAGLVSAWAGALSGSDGSALGLVAETAQLDGAVDHAGPGQPGWPGGPGRAAVRAQAAAMSGLRGGGPVVAGFADTSAGRTGSAQLASQASLGAHALPGAWNSMEGQAYMGVQRNGVAMDGTIAEDAALGASEARLETLAAGLAPTSLQAPRGADSAGAGRPGDGQPGGGLEAALEVRETPGLEGSPAFAEPGQMGAEERVTEQVAYWVNQKTQNAELTVDRDGQPVQVSVTLSGSEAHVSFRSDQQDTRELLDRSAAQLSELLSAEGLVLSGITVGTSTSENAGSPSQMAQSRNREAARQASVAAPLAGSSGPTVRNDRITERSVDVFV